MKKAGIVLVYAVAVVGLLALGSRFAAAPQPSDTAPSVEPSTPATSEPSATTEQPVPLPQADGAAHPSQRNMPSGAAKAPPPPADPSLPVMTAEECDVLIDGCTAYLVKACNPDGSFIYRQSLDPAQTPEPAYNALRHAGTVYALACSQQHRPRPEVRDAILRSLAFMRKTYVRPLPAKPECLAVISQDDPDDAPVAKLGGAALALVASVSAETLFPGTVTKEELRGLGRFILFMQKPDGDFASKYDPESRTFSAWVSLYYPGEAMLALVMLSRLDPDPVWREAAVRGMLHLAEKRGSTMDFPPDHWALLATHALLTGDGAKLVPETRAKLVAHAFGIAEGIVSDERSAARQGAPLGAYDRGGATCPVATRMEGLQALLALGITDGTDFDPLLRATIRRGIIFLRAVTRREEPLRGAVPRAAIVLPADSDKNRTHNRRAFEVRIDYVQHTLCALLQYRQFPATRNTPP